MLERVRHGVRCYPGTVEFVQYAAAVLRLVRAVRRYRSAPTRADETEARREMCPLVEVIGHQRVGSGIEREGHAATDRIHSQATTQPAEAM